MEPLDVDMKEYAKTSHRDWAKMGLPDPAYPKGRRDLYDALAADGYKHVPKEPEDTRAAKHVEGHQLDLFEKTTAANVLHYVERAVDSGDMVNLPQHYARFKIEPIRFIGENGLDWFQGNIVKYTLRHDAKNGLEDLKKARRYVDMYIAFKAGDPDWWKVGKPA